MTGPYLSDPSNLKFVQMRCQQQLSPKTSFIFQNEHLAEEEETSFMTEVKEEPKKAEVVVKKPEMKKKVKNRSDSVISGIEEIRLVHDAVKAFKRKTR